MSTKNMSTNTATVVRELEVEGVTSFHGLTFDGKNVWFADATRGGLTAIDPETGKAVKRLADVPADAGTAFDGTHLYQIAEDRIQKVDPKNGEILGTIPAPAGQCAGLAWAEGALWVGQYKERLLHKIDAKTGKILKTIKSDRFVTGVTWVDGELWHGTQEAGTSDVRRVDPESGAVTECLAVPGMNVAGIEADRSGHIWLADTKRGKVVAINRPRARS